MKLHAEKITSGAASKKSVLKRVIISFVGVGALVAGTLIVSANDGPDVYGTVTRHAPARRAAPPPVVVQRFEAPLPRVFRTRESLPPRAIGFAPIPYSHLAPLNRRDQQMQRLDTFPRGDGYALDGQTNQPRRKAVRKEARRKLQDNATSLGAGLSNATNYCVRTCDGFAFPVGQSGGNTMVQEHACRQACPGAETLLYSAPAGAKDFDAMTRGGVSYSALPTAFRYREKLDSACRCNSPGNATNPMAVLSDLTLRQGDLVMSRAGMRHFDGSRSLPYRARSFSDAISRLESKREVAIVRAMETASVRGILSPKAPNHVRERVVAHVRMIEVEARRESAAQRPQRNLGRGFQELTARENGSKTTLKTVQRRPGIVALN
jgi:Protein of unknown function (DUF2865)